MKEGNKRIHNDDFEQVEKCCSCNKLFWAISELELGNWQTECSDCKIIRQQKEEKRAEFIRKNGKPRYGKNGIFAWTLNLDNGLTETIFNSEYEAAQEEAEIWANGFIDINKFEQIYS